MNIFEQYGIKEVADVCLYSIELDENDDEIYIPVLYLDTLKVSTVEETAEQTSARGGLGNPELIIWDYGKEITVTLEDALYSPASMGMAWGGKHGIKKLEFYGGLYIKDANKTVKEATIKYIIDSFSDFKIQDITLNGVTTKCYTWIVNANLISGDGLFRSRIENLELAYDIKNNKYAFISSSKGDANDDGLVNVLDASALSKWLKEQIGHISENADMDENGTIDISDLVLLKRYLTDIKEKGYIEAAKEHGYEIVLSTQSELNSSVPAQEIIYQIDHDLQNVKYLERIEKCKATQTFVINTDANTEHGNKRYLEQYSQAELTVFIDPKTMQPYEPNTDTFTRKNGDLITGNLRIIKQHEIYYKWTRTRAIDHTSLGHQIIVDAIHFPGTYRLVGETYSRSRKTGKDERFQFEIPLCKMGTENSFTLEAEGDPTTFNMTLKVLRREDGVMMKLTQYSVEDAKFDGYISGSTNIVPEDEVVPEDPISGSE